MVAGLYERFADKAPEINDAKYRVADRGITITVCPTGVKTFSYVEIKNGVRKNDHCRRYPDVRFSVRKQSGDGFIFVCIFFSNFHCQY